MSQHTIRGFLFWLLLLGDTIRGCFWPPTRSGRVWKVSTDRFVAVKMGSFCSLQAVGTKVVMFQADVDSWWNLSLGHAIPAFATRHARQEGNWDGFGWGVGVYVKGSRDRFVGYEISLTLDCRWTKSCTSFYGSNSHFLRYLPNQQVQEFVQKYQQYQYQCLLALRSLCCGARSSFWVGSLLDASGSLPAKMLPNESVRHRLLLLMGSLICHLDFAYRSPGQCWLCTSIWPLGIEDLMRCQARICMP